MAADTGCDDGDVCPRRILVVASPDTHWTRKRNGMLQIHPFALGVARFCIQEHDLAREPSQEQRIGDARADVPAADDGYAVGEGRSIVMARHGAPFYWGGGAEGRPGKDHCS